MFENLLREDYVSQMMISRDDISYNFIIGLTMKLKQEMTEKDILSMVSI